MSEYDDFDDDTLLTSTFGIDVAGTVSGAQGAYSTAQGTAQGISNTAQADVQSLLGVKSLSGAADVTDQMLSQVGAMTPGLGESLAVQIGPDVRQAINTGGEVMRAAGPAINMITKVGSGGTVSAMDAVAAMSATIGAINPLAGAAVFAAASIMNGLADAANGLFTGLGLRHTIPTNQRLIGGMIVGVDSIPTPPDLQAGKYSDSTWITWEQMMKRVREGSSNNYGPYWFERLNQKTDITSMQQSVTDIAMFKLLWVLTPDRGTWQPGYPNVYPNLSKPTNDFEKYLFPMLQRNSEYFYNANAYIDPRTLTEHAVALWNLTHKAGPTRTYVRNEANSDSIVSWIESGIGDTSSGIKKNGKELTVNLGPYVPIPAPPPPPPVVKSVVKLNAANLTKQQVAARQIALKADLAKAHSVASGGLPSTAIGKHLFSLAEVKAHWPRYMPAAIGLVCFPVIGILGPIIGTAVSAAWVELGKR